jgi:hypothetical protein
MGQHPSQWRKRELTHYPTPQRRGRNPIIAVDIETDGLGGAFLVGAYVKEESDHVTVFKTIAEWVRAIFHTSNIGCQWVAHNGGEYDYKYLIDEIRKSISRYKDLRISPLVANKRIIGFILRFRKHRIILKDSFRLMPASLAEISQKLAPQYTKQDIGLKDGVIFNPDNPVHMEYLRYDVLALKYSMLAFRDIVLDNFGVYPEWSIASTAMKAWRHTIPPGSRYFRLPGDIEKFCRNAYRGGIVFLRTTRELQNVATIDVNSMYPHVMRECGVPYGEPMWTAKYYTDRPGIYAVRAYVPRDVPFFIVGHRTQDGTAYPTGVFDTVLTSNEIERAKRHGCSFDILDGVVFSQIIFPFDEFITKCERLRTLYKGTAIEFVVKLLQNSLYGKFGARDDMEEYIISEFPGENWLEMVDPSTGEMVENFWTRGATLDAAYMHPEWAAWITANARGHLCDIAESVGFEHVYYGDTDSLVADLSAVEAARDSGILAVSSDYGAVKVERVWSTFQALAPKVYYGTTTDGASVARAKGIPKGQLRTEDMRAVAAGQTRRVSYLSVNGTLQVIKRSKEYAELRTRAYSNLANSKLWCRDSSGTVRSVHREIAAGHSTNGLLNEKIITGTLSPQAEMAANSIKMP